MQHYAFTDEEYGKVLDNIVVGCVDVAVVYNDQILLERRRSNPIKGEWWIFGGRINKGEDLQEAARRGVERELGLRFEDEDRFVELGAYNLRWPTRREPLTTNGCHHLLIAHMIVISDVEKDKIDSFLSKGRLITEWHQIRQSESYVPDMNAIIDAVQTKLPNNPVA